MESFLRHTPARWNMSSMGLRLRDRGGILSNLQGILSIAIWDILLFWEAFPSCRNRFFPFWLFPLQKVWGNLFLTNCENNSPFTFSSYQKHIITVTINHASAIGKGNHSLDHTSSSLFHLALWTPVLSPHRSP